MSPFVFANPFHRPISGFLSVSRGTSLARAFPRFVMITVSPRSATSSIIRKHRALKSLAAMVNCFTLLFYLLTS